MTGGHRLEPKRCFCFDPCGFSVACWPHRLSGTVQTPMPQSCHQSHRHSSSGGPSCMHEFKKKISSTFDSNLWSCVVCLMDTVVSRLDDRGMASVCVCDWSHMFNSCWTMQPIPLFIDWKLILLRASFMLHCVRVNSIARHHGLVIALHALGDFYTLDVCCSLCLPLQKVKASPEICCSVIKKPPILHLQMLYCPEDQLRWFYFMQCEFYMLLIGTHLRHPKVWFHICCF